jgi:hypothetical protein
MNRKFITICISLFLASASYAAAVDVIGNWENMPTSGDGWIDWGAGQVLIETLPAQYVTEPTIGVTLDDDSLHMIKAGWAQTLSIKLQNNGYVDEFLNHNTFSFDVSVAATPGITAGYTQIDSVSMNSNITGWQTIVSGNPINFYWWSGRPTETKTLNVDYTAFRNALGGGPYSWIEIIITTNNGGGAPPDFYFDNARLSGIPEPATIAMLGLGGLALIRRKR